MTPPAGRKAYAAPGTPPHPPNSPHPLPLPSPSSPSPAARGPLAEAAAFAAVGLAAYAVDLGLFVWLRGPAGFGPLTAKTLSFLAGCTVAYAGNARGTYRGRTPGVSRMRQYAVFFAVTSAGALVQLLCLAVSHHGLGYTSQRADTISGAGVGMALATVLRFWGTRTLVFTRTGCGGTRTAGYERAPAGEG